MGLEVARATSPAIPGLSYVQARARPAWAMPDNPNALDRLLAVVPTSFYEALAVGYRSPRGRSNRTSAT
jgi:hypothetical protein